MTVPGLLTREELLDRLDSDVEAMQRRVLACGPDDLAARVRWCPGWSVRDLVAHTGAVHRWATEVLRTRGVVQEDDPPDLDGEPLKAWFVDSAQGMRSAVHAADPDELAENVRRAARRAAQEAWGKKPITRVLVTEL